MLGTQLSRPPLAAEPPVAITYVLLCLRVFSCSQFSVGSQWMTTVTAAPGSPCSHCQDHFLFLRPVREVLQEQWLGLWGSQGTAGSPLGPPEQLCLPASPSQGAVPAARAGLTAGLWQQQGLVCLGVCPGAALATVLGCCGHGRGWSRLRFTE